MTIDKIAQNFEIFLWGVVIPVIEERGPLMTLITKFRKIFQNRIGLLALLTLVWAAVGFVSGMVLGRIIWMLQLL